MLNRRHFWRGSVMAERFPSRRYLRIALKLPSFWAAHNSNYPVIKDHFARSLVLHHPESTWRSSLP